MKVIDILNKIANGEEVCFKILSEGNVYELTDGANLYNKTQMKEIRWWIDEDWLNEEVEIIEEDKKIEKLDFDWLQGWDEDSREYYSMKVLFEKIDEIIDYINKEDK